MFAASACFYYSAPLLVNSEAYLSHEAFPSPPLLHSHTDSVLSTFFNVFIILCTYDCHTTERTLPTGASRAKHWKKEAMCKT